MSEDTASMHDSWNDGRASGGLSQTEIDEYTQWETKLARFRLGIAAQLDSLIPQIETFSNEYGEGTGMSIDDKLEAYLYRQLENCMVEIGRRALGGVYTCGDLERRTLPAPCTREDTNQVLCKAMDLYERTAKDLEEPAHGT